LSLDIREARHAEGLVVSPLGRVDSNTSGDFERALMTREGEALLVIDLSGIDYISSAGLRVFLMLAKKMKGSGRRLVLCALAPSVEQVFTLAGFTALFTVKPSIDEALGRVSS